MPTLTLTHITFLILATLYLVLAGYSYKRIKRNPAGRPWLILYLLLAASLLLLRFALSLGWIPAGQSWLTPDWAAILALSMAFFFLTQAFFNTLTHARLLRRITFIVAPLGLFLIATAFLPQQWLDSPRGPISGVAIALVAWIVIYGQTALFVRQKLISARRQPLHRNRVAYWYIITVLIASADLLFFTQRSYIAEYFRFAGVLVAVYATLALHLGDIQRMLRRVAGNLITVTFIAVLYLGMTVLVGVFNYQLDSQLLLLLTIFCAFLYQPIYKLIRAIAERVKPHMVHRSGSWIVSEYGQRISKLIELNRLESEVIGLISKGMGLEHGTLFLVDLPGDFRSTYRFKSVQSSMTEPFILGRLEQSDPVAQYLNFRRSPLTQYEIDVMPRFQEGHIDSRLWLKDMGIDVYVPIFLQESWIGLLALGPKTSGQPYDSYELDLLATIADQTAVALENSRLFNNLVVVNRELQKALVDLEKANNRLQESDKVKSAFIGVISHELRTPFANIGFSLNLIERYGTHSWPVDQREELENLQKGIATARNMVEDLVTFATYLSKQVQLEIDAVDFPDLMAETALIMEPLAQHKGLQLRAGARAGDPFSNGHAPIVKGDRQRLGEAIHHLVQNGIKFTPEGGLVDISYWTAEDRAFVCVEDNGIGIPEDKLAGIWDGFTQMADPVRRGAEGLGLGLPLVMHVVRAHGGDIWVESKVGEGSRFGFWVPLVGPAGLNATAPKPIATPTS